jgi:SAM-dependent methyltransferase
MVDRPSGWESIAAEFIAARSDIGSNVVRHWSRYLRPGGDVLDIGCGSGAPISSTLSAEGFRVFGIDASPTLAAMFGHRFGAAQAACETVQDSAFFGRTFDGAAAVGLMFLLPENDQRRLLSKVGKALKPGGRFLFSAPRQYCSWNDLQTGQPSLSLGEEEYARLLIGANLRLVNTYVDDGDNHYFDAVSSST